mmetsp:Transcript_99584/g.319610  ORF Transcript_99584/g.319610 Transcript_99584/m.319610 type:complete len:87 (-) Transcript_99584:25-285(-)
MRMRSEWKHQDMKSGGDTVPRREPATSVAESKLSRIAGITGAKQLSSDLADSVLIGHENLGDTERENLGDTERENFEDTERENLED